MAKLSTRSKTIERDDGSEVDLSLALDKKRRINPAYEIYLGLYQAITGPEDRQKLFRGQAFRHERQSTWLDGIEGALRHFGGVPEEVLLDNARALVTLHDTATREVTFNDRLKAFAESWRFRPRACAPYRALTQGKDERGVGYVKGNAIAAHAFATGRRSRRISSRGCGWSPTSGCIRPARCRSASRATAEWASPAAEHGSGAATVECVLRNHPRRASSATTSGFSNAARPR
jgi:hypothetical protein